MPRTRRRFTAEFKAEAGQRVEESGRTPRARAERRGGWPAEFKAGAVRLLEESGRTRQAIAEELGVHPNQLRTWRNERLAAGPAEALARGKGEAAEPARRRRGSERR